MELSLINLLRDRKIHYLKITDIKVLRNIHRLYTTGFEDPIEDGICYYYYGLHFQLNNEYDKMRKYYEKAIEFGESMAMNNLAYYYSSENNKLAEKYYQMAVSKGNNLAMHNLAVWYRNRRNDVETEKYFLMAIENGNRTSIRSLETYYRDRNDKIKLIDLYMKTQNISGIIMAINDYLNDYREDQKLNTIIINLLQNLDTSDGTMPNGIKIVKKLLVHQMDIMKLHFDYTLHGKGYEEAKSDFINLINKG